MSYIKAEEILPKELVRKIQEYADGVCIYIPHKPCAIPALSHDGLTGNCFIL